MSQWRNNGGRIVKMFTSSMYDAPDYKGRPYLTLRRGFTTRVAYCRAYRGIRGLCTCIRRVIAFKIANVKPLTCDRFHRVEVISSLLRVPSTKYLRRTDRPINTALVKRAKRSAFQTLFIYEFIFIHLSGSKVSIYLVINVCKLIAPKYRIYLQKYKRVHFFSIK